MNYLALAYSFRFDPGESLDFFWSDFVKPFTKVCGRHVRRRGVAIDGGGIHAGLSCS